MTTIPNKTQNSRWFVVLVALAFWIWLAKDVALDIIDVQLATGKLKIICATVLLLLFIAGKPGITRNEHTIHSSRQKSLIAVLFFFGYCVVSGLLSGETAFTVFKLQNLLTSIIIAYALAGKTIRAISMDKRLFFIVGLIIGVATFYSVFSDIRSIMETEKTIGLRAMQVAQGNIINFYVVLFLYAIMLLLINNFHPIDFLFLLIATFVSAPIVIGMNSRMIPFTVGATFIYIVMALRSLISDYRQFVRYALLIAVIAVAGATFGKGLINPESRMMGMYSEGVIETFVDSHRTISFVEALKNFWESPLYGIGFGKFVYPGSYPDPTNRSGTWPHNIFLELLSELGIIGFFLLAVPVGMVLKKVLFAQIKRDHEFIAFPCVVFVYVFTSMQLTNQITCPLLWVAYFCSDAAFHYDQSVSLSEADSNYCGLLHRA